MNFKLKIAIAVIVVIVGIVLGLLIFFATNSSGTVITNNAPVSSAVNPTTVTPQPAPTPNHQPIIPQPHFVPSSYSSYPNPGNFV